MDIPECQGNQDWQAAGSKVAGGIFSILTFAGEKNIIIIQQVIYLNIFHVMDKLLW